MSIIKMNEEIKLENTLSLRKKMNQSQVQEEMMKIDEFLKQNNFERNGSIITATFGVEM